MRKFILTVALISGTTGAALADPDFQTVDTDADGTITFTEAVNAGLPWSESEFNSADENGDGTLDIGEFQSSLE